MSVSCSSASLAYLKRPSLSKIKRKVKQSPSRFEVLARPSKRRLEELWLEKGFSLPPQYSNNIKSALEAEYFYTPEQTEDYFRNGSSQNFNKKKKRKIPPPERRQWLSDFSSQVAQQLCQWVVQNRDYELKNGSLKVKELADAVLEKVANVLGERKPSRKDKNRLARFMLAISDRIAIWIDDVIKGANQGLSSSLLSLQNL